MHNFEQSVDIQPLFTELISENDESVEQLTNKLSEMKMYELILWLLEMSGFSLT